MLKKEKSRFIKWFSFSRHIRRKKASNYLYIFNEDISDLKQKVINTEKIKYTHGSKNDIEDHMEDLRSEFSGQSELCYTIAKIIVLIRRNYKTEKYFDLFEKIWLNEYEFLLKNLNTRWLISSSDTFADQTKDQTELAYAIACSCLINSVKISESERFLEDAEMNKINKKKKLLLDSETRFPLFDGMSVFKFGTDDTLRNMSWRFNKIPDQLICGKILKEVFNRLQIHDTAFKRAKLRHSRKRTEWWN